MIKWYTDKVIDFYNCIKNKIIHYHLVLVFLNSVQKKTIEYYGIGYTKPFALCNLVIHFFYDVVGKVRIPNNEI